MVNGNQLLEKQGYRFTGNHSSVKICSWTKKSLVDKGVCYKEQFYGIKSHRCCQMTPCMFCCNSCEFCWRSMDDFSGLKIKGDVDEPKSIIKNCIEKQRELLNGFPGNESGNMKKFNEAQDPSNFAISLSGEPTIYPYLSELITELDKMKKCSFLVTNGQFPKVIENLKKLPTQLYVSLDAPTKQIYKKIDKPMLKDYWKRFNKTLELINGLNTRTCLRLTMVKGLNMCEVSEYAKLIKKASPNFIEVKSYMHVGSSRDRLKRENMPFHEDVKEFSEKLVEKLGWKIVDEKKESRVVLLMKEDFRGRVMNFK